MQQLIKLLSLSICFSLLFVFYVHSLSCSLIVCKFSKRFPLSHPWSFFFSSFTFSFKLSSFIWERIMFSHSQHNWKAWNLNNKFIILIFCLTHLSDYRGHTYLIFHNDFVSKILLSKFWNVNQTLSYRWEFFYLGKTLGEIVYKHSINIL